MAVSHKVPSRSLYRPEIDGLRAVAVLAVIVNHFNKDLLPGGYLGVDIFFVISGFVITASMAARRPAPSAADFLLGFYTPRVKRILPALLLCILITGLVISLFDPRPQTSLATGIAALFGVSNVFLYHQATDYFARSAELNAFTHTWSLGVEEQFYLMFPLLVWCSGFGRATAAGRRNLFLVTVLASLASLIAFLVFSGSQPAAAFFLLPARFWELGAGCLLFLILDAGRTLPILDRLPSVALFGLLVGALLLPQRWQTSATLCVVGLTLLLIAATKPGTLLQIWLSHPWAVKLGLLSYSLYLWHWSVLSISRWTIGIQAWTIPLQIGAMLVLATASYRFVERPLRLAPWCRFRWQTIAYGLLAAILVCLPLWALADPLRGRLFLGRPLTAEGKRDGGAIGIDGTRINGTHCGTDAKDGEVLASRSAFETYAALCTASPAEGPSAAALRHLYVVGDSHAMAFSPLANKLFQSGDFVVSIFGRPGCPFPDTLHGSTLPGCSRFTELVQEHILVRARSGDVVVVAVYHLSHLGDPSTFRDTREHFRGADGKPLTTGKQKQQAYGLAINAFAQKAHGRGVQTVLIGAAPRNLDYETCFQEWFNLQGASRCEKEVKREVAHAIAMNRHLQAGLSPDVDLLDPMPILCAGGCDNLRVSTVLRDKDHLTEKAVLLLQDPFQAILEPELPHR